jgi:centrosomal protein CEP104
VPGFLTVQAVGGKVAQLEARKRLAVEREDYDLAKALKADIEKLRSAGETAALSSPPGQQQRPQMAPAPAARQQQRQHQQRQHSQRLAGEGSEGPEGLLAQGSQADAAAGADYDADAGLHTGGSSGGYADQYSAVHTYQAYEDRPAVAKGAYAGRPGSAGGEDGGADEGVADLDDENLIKADPSRVSAAAMFGGHGGARSSGVSKKALASHAGGSGGARGGVGGPGSLAAAAGTPAAAHAAADVCGAEPPDGWPSDLPAPEPLAAAVSASDAGPVIDVAGEFVAAAFFSRSWQLRDAAAAWLADLTSNGRLSGGAPERRELARGLVRLAVKGLKDKVPQVYSSSLSLLQVRCLRMRWAGWTPGVVGEVALTPSSMLCWQPLHVRTQMSRGCVRCVRASSDDMHLVASLKLHVHHF